MKWSCFSTQSKMIVSMRMNGGGAQHTRALRISGASMCAFFLKVYVNEVYFTYLSHTEQVLCVLRTKPETFPSPSLK